MGNKFKFPGRRPKEQQANVSVPLTKAQKILGSGHINTDAWATDSPPPSSRPWTSRSSSTANTDAISPKAYTSRSHRWDQESEIIPPSSRLPRRGLGGDLKGQRSAVNIAADYHDDAFTDDSSLRRRQSQSSVNSSYYEKSNVPLSISQQTSNSAIAQGLPSKASFLLDMDGALSDARQKKKKPARLDFSLLRRKNREPKPETPPSQPTSRAPSRGGPPVLGNDFVMDSPLDFSPSIRSPTSPYGPTIPPPDHRSPNRAPPPIVIDPTQTALYQAQRQNRDTVRMRQLYDHYEQMSLRHAPSPVDETDEPSYLEPKSHDGLMSPGQRSKASTTSQEARSITSSRLDGKNEYSASISSRHTRTSKASQNRSMFEYDRQQQSVLSLSDSDSDSESGPSESPCRPVTAPDHARQRPFSPESASPGVPRLPSLPKSKPLYSPLDDRVMRSQSAAKARNSVRSSRTFTLPSHGYKLSRISDASTGSSNATPRGSMVQQPPSAPSAPSAPSSETTKAPRHSAYGMQPYRPIAPPVLPTTIETAMDLDSPGMSSQPTPPISPSSMEIYVGPPSPIEPAYPMARESPDRDDRQNGRYMEVTEAEELLLAALRQKRAKMQEKGQVGRGNRSSDGSDSSNVPNTAGVQIVVSDASVQKSQASSQTTNFPKRSSSLIPNNYGMDEPTRDGFGAPQGADTPPPSNNSHRAKVRPTSIFVPDSLEVSARQERVLLYLDQPGRSEMPSPANGAFDNHRAGGFSKRMPKGQSHSTTPAGGRASPEKRQLDEVPEVDDDVDEDDISFDDFPNPGTGGPVGEKVHELTSSQASSIRETPSQGHVKNKGSVVRLSAVGQPSASPMPWWGDDD